MILLLAATMLAVDPSLLERLAQHDERMEQYLDAHEVSISGVVRDLDGDGKLIHTTVSKLKQRRVNGKLQTKVISATKDGADDLEGEQKRAAERDEKNERTESPFAARNQPKYVFKAIGPSKPGASDLLLSFEPKEPGTRVLKGVAVVDPEAGEVVKLVMEPSKLPTFVDAMKLELEYETRTPAGRNVSKFVLAGAGGLLFIKRQGDLTMTFSFE